MSDQSKLLGVRPGHAGSRAAALAEYHFPGIRPSVSRWAIWAIAVSWMAVVSIALWVAARHGQNIDQPGESNSAMILFFVMMAVFVAAPYCCFWPSEGEAKLVFWLAFTFPWTLLACWIITNRLSIPMPKDDWWEIYQELNARDRLVFLVLVFLSIAVGLAAAVTSYAFPSLSDSAPAADGNPGEVPPPYSTWDAVRPSGGIPLAPYPRRSGAAPTGSTRLSGSDRKYPTPDAQDLAIRSNR